MKIDLEKKILKEDLKMLAYAVKDSSRFAVQLSIGLCMNPLVPLVVSMILLPEKYQNAVIPLVVSPLSILYFMANANACQKEYFSEYEDAFKKRKELLEEYNSDHKVDEANIESNLLE